MVYYDAKLKASIISKVIPNKRNTWHGYTDDNATKTLFQSESTNSEIDAVNLIASFRSWMSEKPSEGEGFQKRIYQKKFTTTAQKSIKRLLESE